MRESGIKCARGLYWPWKGNITKSDLEADYFLYKKGSYEIKIFSYIIMTFFRDLKGIYSQINEHTVFCSDRR